jgi:MFS family permease
MLSYVFVVDKDAKNCGAVALLLIFLLFLVSLVLGVIPLPFTVHGLLPIAWQLGAIYGIVFLASACAQFFNPSSLALLSDIVDEPQIARGSGMIQAAFNFAILIGPPLGALLFFAAGVQWGLLLNVLSFVVSFISISAIRAPRMVAVEKSKLPASFLREFVEGIRFFGRSRVLMALGITGVLIVLGAGALNALDVFFVTQNLHAQVSLYGFLGSALGCGLIAGSVLAAMFAQRIGVTRTFWLSVVGWGVVALVYARLTSFFLAAVVLFFLGVMNAVFNATASPLIIQATPRNFIGRVMAVFNPLFSLVAMLSVVIASYLGGVYRLVIFGSLALGQALFGVCLQQFGVPVTVGILWIWLILFSIGMLANPRVRGANLPHEE